MEVWKDIPEYEGHYQASNLGKIRSIKRSTQILKGDYQRNGYKRVYLWKNGNKRNLLVHRLVALTILPNPNDYSDINHIDEDKSNNRIDNLEWCSRRYNMNYGQVKEKISIANRGRKPHKNQLIKLSNSSKNRKWISKGNVEKFIKISNIPFFIAAGWKIGRKEKNHD